MRLTTALGGAACQHNGLFGFCLRDFFMGLEGLRVGGMVGHRAGYEDLWLVTEAILGSIQRGKLLVFAHLKFRALPSDAFHRYRSSHQ